MIELIILLGVIAFFFMMIRLNDKYGPKVYTAERGSSGRMVLIIKRGYPEDDPEWIYHSSKQTANNLKDGEC